MVDIPKYSNIYVAAIVLAVLVNIFSWQFPFFWDTILTSTITQHYFHYGFGNLIIPPDYDAGHPPFFYVYITGIYHLLGKSLFAAHFSVLPFTLLGMVSFIRLMRHFSFTSYQQYTGLILFFLVPAVITQYILVSYDAALLSLYLCALVAFLKNKKALFALVLAGIAAISLRGLFCLAALSATIFFLQKNNLKSWCRWNLLFLPALLLAGGWYTWHFMQTGWWLSTPSAGWSGQRGLADAIGLFKNTVSVARCFFDFGMMPVFLISLFYFLQKRKMDSLTILWLIPFVLFTVCFLPFTNPVNHRYFLIVYVLMLLPLVQFLFVRRKLFTVLVSAALLLGNWQIYPVPVSNGWDCSLAHLSYHSCRKDFFLKIKKDMHVDRNRIGTVFPMNTSLYQTDMEEDTIRMINVNGHSIDSLEYVLYSNIGNDFSTDQLRQIKDWNADYSVNHGMVQLVLYSNPKFLHD